MNIAPEVLAVVRQWVEKAEHDLKNAEYTLTMDTEECPYDTICFHAQQCADKYLKALLTFQGIDFPKSHDLTELVALIPQSFRIEFPKGELEELNPYAIETRYPGDWESYEREDAVRAIEVAKKVRQAIHRHLPPQVVNDKEEEG